MNIVIFLVAVMTAFLLGATFGVTLNLPVIWGIWGFLILVVLFVYMIKNNK